MIQIALHRCLDHCAGVLQLHALSHSISSSAPTGIDQPNAHTMLFQPLSEHGSIFCRRKWHKWSSKACTKCGLRFRYSHLGAGHLGRVSAQEVVHRLAIFKPAYWRHYAESIAREKENILGVASLSFRDSARYVVQRV